MHTWGWGKTAICSQCNRPARIRTDNSHDDTVAGERDGHPNSITYQSKDATHKRRASYLQLLTIPKRLEYHILLHASPNPALHHSGLTYRKLTYDQNPNTRPEPTPPLHLTPLLIRQLDMLSPRFPHLFLIPNILILTIRTNLPRLLLFRFLLMQLLKRLLPTFLCPIIKDQRDLFDRHSTSLRELPPCDNSNQEVQEDVQRIVPPRDTLEGDGVDELVECVGEIVEGDVDRETFGTESVGHEFGDVGVVESDPGEIVEGVDAE